MSLDPDLVTRYTTEMRKDWHDAYVLSHPSSETVYLIDHSEEFEGLVDGYLRLFLPVPAQRIPPSRDDSGRQDAAITWAGVGGEAREFLDAAIADATQPVTCRWSIYLEGDQEPKIVPWVELALTNIAVTRETVSAIATRADILNRPFPTEVYRVERYPGLRRR